MKSIHITERLRPFSHQPGTCCLLPGSTLRFQIFPALLRVFDISTAYPKFLEEISVPVKGPVQEFTVQLDLERGWILVWGKTEEEFFRYIIQAGETSIHVDVQKGLSSWHPQELFSRIPYTHQPFNKKWERLSLGNHKSQDWEMVSRRADLGEILPALLALGQQVPDTFYFADEGTTSLLLECQNASKLIVYPTFINFFKASFEGILSPRLVDEQHQGFSLKTPSLPLSPLVLLSRGAKTIRSLFVHTHAKEISILPKLPPQFHCGRFLGVQCEDFGALDLEWSKKAPRRLLFKAYKTEVLHFHFPHEITDFRLNGKRHLVKDPIEVISGEQYIFDRFQK